MRIGWLFIVLFFVMTAPLANVYADQSDVKKDTVEEKVFRKIYKLGYRGNYLITGEAKGKFNHTFYSVKDGHIRYIDEREVNFSKVNGGWRPFKITVTIPQTALPKQGTVVLTLYEKKEKGEIVHSFPVVLDQF